MPWRTLQDGYGAHGGGGYQLAADLFEGRYPAQCRFQRVDHESRCFPASLFEAELNSSSKKVISGGLDASKLSQLQSRFALLKELQDAGHVESAPFTLDDHSGL